jgi:hypothetical protein
MLLRRNEVNTEDFWREYEEKIGEKVFARSLGQYISGWEEFDSNKWNALWGLIIATSGGFRFHHFPQVSWFNALSRSGSHNAPKEKTIFLPKEKILSAQIIEEKKWWKKILTACPPQSLIDYRDEMENEKRIVLEVGIISGNFKEEFIKTLSPLS